MSGPYRTLEVRPSLPKERFLTRAMRNPVLPGAAMTLGPAALLGIIYGLGVVFRHKEGEYLDTSSNLAPTLVRGLMDLFCGVIVAGFLAAVIVLLGVAYLHLRRFFVRKSLEAMSEMEKDALPPEELKRLRGIAYDILYFSPCSPR